MLKNYHGMTLWPFLLVKDKSSFKDAVFMNHEHIHAAQQKELGVIFFYLWYAIEYVILRLKYNHDRAYRNIIFEREAYYWEANLEYLSTRKIWSFTRFYSNKYRK